MEELLLEEEVFPEDVVGEEGGLGGLQVHEPVDKIANYNKGWHDLPLIYCG